METASSPNTVINLFDYWLSDEQSDRLKPDNISPNLGAGINKDHAFKFSRGQDDQNAVNQWTGGGQNPRQGIVANTLTDGFPMLSGNEAVNGIPSTESLAYLFDPTIEHPGKASYRNVGGLLYIDSQGYYAYDCKEHAAEFDEKNNNFNVYDKPTAGGQFFPFNKTPEVMYAKRDDPKINHYFGVTITNRFVQRHSGHTDEKHSTPTTFEFSGDDDVWIFIDGVLVGDVGGIHDAAHVSINFATGEVEVGVNEGTATKLTTTLQKCYQDAGKYNEEEWTTTENGHTIYKDGTVHTLKFFYLERGNYNSNMKLKYNMIQIPKTAIYKVDQYGEAVPGATFAVYAANEQYDMLYNKGGNKVDLTDNSYTYDKDGNILDSNGNILVHALYTGTTDQAGEMLFADLDDMPYSIRELEEMFGKYFILREIKVPEGYRLVNKDVHLQIWQGANQKILKCDNTDQSGSRASANMQITATDTLYLQNYEQTSVNYFDSNTNTTNGTLFAVIYKYIGAIDENGNATDINADKNWVPVYGSDQGGYTKVDMSNDKSLIDGALEAARKGQAYGDVVFKLSPSGTMQLTLENMPGHITTYYYMLSDGQKEQARYTAVYYWTEADTLEGATEANTYRVYTFSEAVPDGTSYSGFERVFGADIHVPNLINKVFVQKVDEKNNLINGATFAIYQVNQLEDGTIQYFSEEDKGYHTLSANAVIASNGEITDGTIHIRPLATDVTHSYTDGIHTGTAEFTNLPDGQYIVKEVNPPPGYRINTADVMVLVTEDTIYANAGTEDDGVTVGRGPGYLVTPLEQFAAEDQIDNTLTWINSRMLITYPSTRFADVGDVSKIKGYIKENYTNLTTKNLSEAFKTNLIYDADKEGAAFNYVPDPKRNKGTDSDGYRRIFTTEGWNYYSIFQDYEYGKSIAEKNGANYENWSGRNLMHLFSRSTYIRVMDEQETTLKVKKVDATTPSALLSGATFRLYRTAEDGTGEKLYYAWDAKSKKALWTKDETQALVVTTGANGIADGEFYNLKDGTYYLEEIRSPDGYIKMTDPVDLNIAQAKLTVDFHSFTVENVLDETTNLYTYTLVVPNRGEFMFPATGGNGTILYTLGGILLMGISLVCGYRKKRRSERGVT